MTRILLGVTGSAACFKAVALCSELVQSGHEVQPVLTRSASRLVTPLQFSCVAGCRALDDEWEPSDPAGMDHIALARDDELISPIGVDNDRRSPTGARGAFGAPNTLAALLVEGRDERLPLVILVQDDLVFVENRRAEDDCNLDMERPILSWRR